MQKNGIKKCERQIRVKRKEILRGGPRGAPRPRWGDKCAVEMRMRRYCPEAKVKEREQRVKDQQSSDRTGKHSLPRATVRDRGEGKLPVLGPQPLVPPRLRPHGGRTLCGVEGAQ